MARDAKAEARIDAVVSEMLEGRLSALDKLPPELVDTANARFRERVSEAPDVQFFTHEGVAIR